MFRSVSVFSELVLPSDSYPGISANASSLEGNLIGVLTFFFVFASVVYFLKVGEFYGGGDLLGDLEGVLGDLPPVSRGKLGKAYGSKDLLHSIGVSYFLYFDSFKRFLTFAKLVLEFIY